MKKIIAVLVVLFIGIPVFSKSEVREIKTGVTSQEVKEFCGKPNIITIDSDGFTAWVYEKTNQRPCKFCTKVPFDSSTTLVVKFDSEERVKNFAYKTIFKGVKYD